MITATVVQIVIAIVNAVFSWIPPVTALPVVNGYDLDAGITTAMGQFNAVAVTFWWLKDIFLAALLLMTYYGFKMIFKAIMGSRAPGNH